MVQPAAKVKAEAAARQPHAGTGMGNVWQEYADCRFGAGKGEGTHYAPQGTRLLEVCCLPRLQQAAVRQLRQTARQA